jgi:predicted ATPase/serine/threonine protein kinase
VRGFTAKWAAAGPAMDAERWGRVDQLLQSALLVSPERRDEFLCRECAGDTALEAEVRSLLDSHRNAESFLERPAIRVAAEAMAQAVTGEVDLLCGRTISHYQILKKLGAGGMGEVYRARDTRLNREVAIKTLPLDRLSQPDAISRFEKEARAACALNHPNIVTIYELGQMNGMHYIAMELVEGETIRELLASGPIPFRKAVAIASQIGDALAKAHEVGIVHRDLKPENLMVTGDGVCKVLDFGLAKLRTSRPRGSDASNSTVSEYGTVMGTVGYMSPEQATGSEVDFRSDLFSLGSVLFEMVTGFPAFRKKTYAETTAAILRDEPEQFGSRMLQAPAPFIWIVERCLAKDPKQRYASTRDLARDLVAVRDRLADAPARDSDARPNNLPVQRTALIGREQEEAALRQLLSDADVRLVTLTGPGGIGKTRLALRVAGEIGGQFPGGVCFVALSAVAELGLVPAIAQALGLRETGNQSPQEVLKEYVAGLSQPVLLLLDNFEHLVSTAPMVAQLLTIGPKLKAMVTSQAPLHVYGEHEFPVPPLALPDLKSIPPLEILSRLPAVALFVERARAVKREFALTRENAPAVAAICARLDGLPLAIELAAARIKLLSPSAMLARLESSLNLLTGGARDLPTRQQTLRGTVDWSYGLLNHAEQTLFRRLSVFTGGCTLEGVEAVCDTRGDLGLDILDGVASMVDKSLAQQVEQVDEETRFYMLSTIREYARERLSQSDDEPATRRAHAAYYLVLAEEGAEDAVVHPEWLDRFELEHDNFRTALDYLIKTGDADWGLRLGAALFRFWETREHLTEGRNAIARLLALEGGHAHPKSRARLLFAGAVLAGEQGAYGAARQLFEESRDTCLALNDKRGVAVALNALAVSARERGDIAAASTLSEQCVAIWKDVGDSGDIARALSNLAGVMKFRGEYARASQLYDECLAMFRKAGDGAGVAWTLNYQGDVAREQADFTAAHSFCEQSLAAFRQLRDGWGIASTLSDLASLCGDQGNNAEARRLFGESLRMFQELGHQRGIARVLESLAVSAAAQSNAERSLILAGVAAALRQRLGAPLRPAEQPRLDKALEFARRSLGSAAGLAAWMEGWAMPVEQAVEEALGSAAHPAANPGVQTRNPA